jgi:23S rRNA pseudouridine2604 synthase
MGLCSRREADVWIENGWVLVNGQPSCYGGESHFRGHCGGRSPRTRPPETRKSRFFCTNPSGYVSGQAEDGHEPAITLIHGRSHWREDTSKNRIQPSQLRGLAPAGRLDIDSVGLLVLTQDGRVARQLIGEDSEIEKNIWSG